MNDYGLYRIRAEINACIDPETGEVDAEKFDALVIERDQKIEDIGKMYINLISEADKAEAEIKRLKERQDDFKNRAEKLKELISLELHGEPFKTALITIGYRKSEMVVIDDISAIPTEYLKYANPTADKIGIKAAVKRGETVAGAHIENKLNMSIK